MVDVSQAAGDLRSRFRQALETGNNQAGQIIAGEIRRVAPVDTGFLRNHIFSRKDGDEIVVFTNVPYARYPQRRTSSGRRRRITPRSRNETLVRSGEVERVESRQPLYWREGVRKGLEVAEEHIRNTLNGIDV